MKDSHLDAIEAVLERHGLALVAEIDGGDVDPRRHVLDDERRVWDALCRLGRLTAIELARAVRPRRPGRASASSSACCRRRLAMRLEQSYVAVGAAQ